MTEGFRASHSVVNPITIWESKVKCQNGKRDKWMVRCTKRSATGLYSLSIPVQHQVRVVNAPSADRLRWPFRDWRKAGDQFAIHRRHSAHCKHVWRAAGSRQWVHNAAVSVGMRLNVKKTENITCQGRQVPNHSESRFGYFKRGALFQIPWCKVQRWSNVCRGSKNENGSRKGQVDSLATLWRSRSLSNESKGRLVQALIWLIVTYRAEAWTLNKELTGNIEAFEMQCYQRVLRIPYTEHVSNAEVLDRTGQQRKLLGNAT